MKITLVSKTLFIRPHHYVCRVLGFPVLMAIAVLSSVSFANASLFPQIGQDIDGENSEDRAFRGVLSGDGLTLAVGTGNNDDAGAQSGHVRVYRLNNNNSAWIKLGADIDGDEAGDYFGRCLAVSNDGDRIAIGAPQLQNVQERGYARIYEWDGGAWSPLGDYIRGTDYDRVGCSIALSGDGTTVAIGADGNGDADPNAGQVTVLKWDGSDWTLLGSGINGVGENDASGDSISLSDDGTVVAIGAAENDDSFPAAGHVRVFAYASGAWGQRGAAITGDANGDRLGSSAALSSDGNRLVVGARLSDNGGLDATGQVSVYDWNGNAWVQVGADIFGSSAEDYAGFSVDISGAGERIAVGVYGEDGGAENTGGVTVYQQSGASWQQVGQVYGESADDNAGYWVSLSNDGERVTLGSSQHDGDSGTKSGQVRVFGRVPLSPGVLWFVSRGSGPCLAPGTEITDANFDAAITDWFAKGNASEYGDITEWCTEEVTDMAYAFQDRETFNQDISGWDTSNVTTMLSMFEGATAFNQSIGSWDTGNVTTMAAMFKSATVFNQPIGGWRTGQVADMTTMFYLAEYFNQPIGDWDTRNVASFKGMFMVASAFNQPIGDWVTSNVTSMALMFYLASQFDQPIGNWDTSKVTNLQEVFKYASAFDQNISAWDVSKASNMVMAFYYAESFNQDLQNWSAANLPSDQCTDFAIGADAWLTQYGGSVAKTPPLSTSMISANCGQ